MNIMLICLIIWYITGLISIIYVYTEEFDLTTSVLFPILVCAIVGNIILCINWIIELPKMKPTILIKRRG